MKGIQILHGSLKGDDIVLSKSDKMDCSQRDLGLLRLLAALRLSRGQAPHSPYRRVHEEILMVMSGTVTANIAGQVSELGPGGMAHRFERRAWPAKHGNHKRAVLRTGIGR